MQIVLILKPESVLGTPRTLELTHLKNHRYILFKNLLQAFEDYSIFSPLFFCFFLWFLFWLFFVFCPNPSIILAFFYPLFCHFPIKFIECTTQCLLRSHKLHHLRLWIGCIFLPSYSCTSRRAQEAGSYWLMYHWVTWGEVWTLVPG